MAFRFRSVIPVLRIFDSIKADEFYIGYLGFQVDWSHRFDDESPLYRQISKAGLILHLSEHHGDGSPGANIRVVMTGGLVEYHAELKAKKYEYMRAGLEEGLGPGSLEMTVIDPFGNRITFCQDEKNLKET